MVEKRAMVAGGGRRPNADGEGLKSVVAGRLRTSIVNAFGLAIVDAGSRW